MKKENKIKNRVNLSLKNKGRLRGVFDQNPSCTFPYALREGQCGRSMVEMLGVLAVIGVISVTGIGGYTIAMNKHRANELLNEASKRAAVVAMQIAAGKSGNISLTEFETNSFAGGTFDENASYTAGAETFTIGLSGVSEGVCNQMKSISGNNGIMTFTENCPSATLALTFNKDLKPGVTASGSSSGNGDNNEEEEPSIACESALIQVYDCETKQTTACCPDGGSDCSQPRCDCSSNNDCQTGQICCEDAEACGEVGKCTCPDWGELGIDGHTCCSESIFPYDATTSSYSETPDFGICGCGGVGDHLGSDRQTCCYGGYAVVLNDQLETTDIVPAADVCGCAAYRSEDGSEVTVGEMGYCCMDGYTQLPDNQNGYVPGVCGCPWGGWEDANGNKPTEVNGHCCMDCREIGDDGTGWWGYATLSDNCCAPSTRANMILDLITAGIAESSFEQFYNPDGSEVPDVTQITADGTGLYNYAGFTGICSSAEGNVYDGLPGHAPCIATVFVSENPGIEEEACGDSAMSELIGQTFTVSGISYVIESCSIYGE